MEVDNEIAFAKLLNAIVTVLDETTLKHVIRGAARVMEVSVDDVNAILDLAETKG